MPEPRSDLQEVLNGDADLANLSLDDPKSDLENVPISSSGSLPDTMEQVLFHYKIIFITYLWEFLLG